MEKKSIYEFTTAIDYFQSLYNGSKAVNPRISLRSFAGKIGLDQSTLTRYFSKERFLSSQKAASIAEKLGLSNDEAHYLKLLVLLGDRGEIDLLNKLKASFFDIYEKKAKDIQSENGVVFLQNLEFFLTLKVCLIYELQNLEKELTVVDILHILTKYFETDQEQVYKILNSLISIGLLEENSKKKRQDLIERVLVSTKDTPREVGLQFHKDALRIATSGLERFENTDIEIYTMLVPVKKEGRDKILGAIKQLSSVISEYSCTDGDDVYLISNLSMNLTSEIQRKKA